MSMNIQLPADLAGYVAVEVGRGRFTNESAAVAEALDLLRRIDAKRAVLKADIEEGMAGEGIPAEEVLAELEELVKGLKSRSAVA
jgi:putative addiction module CopG family antidote